MGCPQRIGWVGWACICYACLCKRAHLHIRLRHEALLAIPLPVQPTLGQAASRPQQGYNPTRLDGELSVGLSCEVSEQTAAAQHSKVTSCRELARVAFLRAREAVLLFQGTSRAQGPMASLVLGHQPTVGRSDIEDSKVFACLEGELNLWAKPKE